MCSAYEKEEGEGGRGRGGGGKILRARVKKGPG